MAEIIFEIDGGVYNEQMNEVCFKPKYVGELIRCRDCVRWKDPRDYVCPYHTSGDPFIDDDPDEDFFCAKGERQKT